jgi:DNA-binding GntR family transcriptional regulator
MATSTKRTSSAPPIRIGSAKAAPAPRRNGDLAGEAYRRLEEEIVTLRLTPGSVVTEVQLAERVGLGRTPVRHALRQLAAECLVQIVAQRGIRIAPIDLEQQFQVLELRREVDRLIARCAAQRASESSRTEFNRIAKEFAAVGRAGEEIEFLRIDREFNALERAAARNSMAARVMDLLQPLGRRFWHYHYERNGDLPTAARLHAALAAAIAQGDEQAAADASDRLMDFIFDFTNATVRGYR